MAFFKFRWPLGGASKGRDERPPAASQGDSVEVLRRRARHRLIGAAVLVLAGVIGFPLLFDTQPRPIPVDIPILIPDKNKAPALALPASPAGVDAGLGPDEEVVASSARADGRAVPASKAVAENRKDATPPAPRPEPKPVAKPEPRPEPKPEPKPEAKAEHKAEPKPDRKPEPKAEPKAETRVAAKPEPKPEPKSEPRPEAKADNKADAKAADDAARARALLEGKSPAEPAHAPAAAEAARFIVQVGAFSDAGKAREARQKLEKAGLKTYTQVVETADGKRVRVRVGPFAGKAEADKAAARIKSLDLPASILTL